MNLFKNKHSHTYRADIDGLRAIAVLAVLIYHAGFYWQGQKLLAGGFLGVDIFFVISGYLICSVLLKEINAGQLSFAAFYERRARRILPALFLVMVCSIIIAPVLLPSAPLKEFAASIAATSAFVSNFFFWLQDSYTAAPSLRKPLLHTWSLAVEEQFYLLFPLFLWLVWKKISGKFMLAFSLVAMVSLLYAEWASHYLPSANFYLLPARIWALLAGAMLAHMHSRGKFKHPHGLLAWLGLALVVASLVVFDDTTRHPSLLTLLPVMGTVMMIAAVPASAYLNKLLSSRLMVGIGLISYSLYLWHQPVFAFARIYTEMTATDKLMLIALCLVLATISWHYVEKPFRQPDKMPRRSLVRNLGGCSLVLLAFVAVVMTSTLRPLATTKTTPYPMCSALSNTTQNGKHCLERSPPDACVFVAGSGRQHWYLVGDSVAGSLAYSLWQHLQDKDARLVELTKGDCPYIPNIRVLTDGRVRCSESDNRLRRKLLMEAEPSTVVIHSLLHIYLHGSRQRPHLVSGVHTMQTATDPHRHISELEARRYVRQAIQELLQHGHTVVLVYPIHMADFDMQHRLAELVKIPPRQRKNLLAAARFSKSYQEFRTFADAAYQIYDAVSDHPNLIRVLPEKLFCDPSLSGRCKIFNQNTSLYTDFSHLSHFGACQLVNAIFAALPRQMHTGSAHICRPTCR